MKFFLGIGIGLAFCALTLVGTIGGFVAGLVWGWKLSEADRQPRYRSYHRPDRPRTPPAPTTSEEETPAT